MPKTLSTADITRIRRCLEGPTRGNGVYSELIIAIAMVERQSRAIAYLKYHLREMVSNSTVYGEIAGEKASELLEGISETVKCSNCGEPIPEERK